MGKTRDEKYLIVGSGSSETSESHFLDLTKEVGVLFVEEATGWGQYSGVPSVDEGASVDARPVGLGVGWLLLTGRHVTCPPRSDGRPHGDCAA